MITFSTYYYSVFLALTQASETFLIVSAARFRGNFEVENMSDFLNIATHKEAANFYPGTTSRPPILAA